MSATTTSADLHSADTRTVPCDYCDDGWAEHSPTPTPNGPHYTYSQCTACGGTGHVEIELAPIEQEDLPTVTESGQRVGA